VTADHDPLDLIDVDAGLDDVQVQVRDMVAKLVRGRYEPEFADWFESGVLPMRDIARQLGELGLFGIELDGYGCAGMDSVAYGVACRELKAGNSGLRSFVSGQDSLAMFPIEISGRCLLWRTLVPLRVPLRARRAPCNRLRRTRGER
jgi:glutaryl-CoA dehydrogenase